MNQRRIAIFVAVAFVSLVVAGIATWQWRAGESADGHDDAIYYCPMHPSVTSDKPGNCPICGMKLVKRTGSPQADKAAQIAQSARLEPGVTTVSLPATQRVLANVKTGRVVSTSSGGELVTTGRVTFDERRLAQVTSYTAGRIEQLYVNFTGDSVVRGRPVAAIYSPDLLATQQEYVLALQNRERMRNAGFAQARSAADALVESARRRLMLFGMTAAQIDRLGAGSDPLSTSTIVSPVSGVVTRKLVVPQQYVTAGQPLFEVADLSTVWVEADVYEQALPQISSGQSAKITSPALPGYELPGTVTFINPVVEGQSRATAVRIELQNRNLQLKPGMYVTVKFLGATGRFALTVPAAAVIDRGRQQFIWVEVSPGTYSPRQVSTGARTADRIEILSGLSGGEVIVVEGAFLIDSEAQLRAATGGTNGQMDH
jgi:Cu(I)/Ag(I) efflux system membrane fusion protein